MCYINFLLVIIYFDRNRFYIYYYSAQWFSHEEVVLFWVFFLPSLAVWMNKNNQKLLDRSLQNFARGSM